MSSINVMYLMSLLLLHMYVLKQEREHLKMAVAKIEAHKPDLLLVEKSVSRMAQDMLLYKNISLVLNIKRPHLERIALCTNAIIAPSADLLAPEQIGTCDLFHVDKFTEVHEYSDQTTKIPMKNMMFFEGCPRPETCTVSPNWEKSCLIEMA
jgi:1-phosphatidylinositol-3-phosphate 5-kinase